MNRSTNVLCLLVHKTAAVWNLMDLFVTILQEKITVSWMVSLPPILYKYKFRIQEMLTQKKHSKKLVTPVERLMSKMNI